MDGVVFFCLGIWARKFWSAFSGSRFRPPQVFWNLAHREVFQHVYMFKQKLKFKEYPYKVYFQFAAVWAGYFAFRMERCRCPRSNLTWSRPRGSWVYHVLTILTHQIMRQRSTERWDNETTLKERLVHVGERNLGGSLARVNAASATFFGKVQANISEIMGLLACNVPESSSMKPGCSFLIHEWNIESLSVCASTKFCDAVVCLVWCLDWTYAQMNSVRRVHVDALLQQPCSEGPAPTCRQTPWRLKLRRFSSEAMPRGSSWLVLIDITAHISAISHCRGTYHLQRYFFIRLCTCAPSVVHREHFLHCWNRYGNSFPRKVGPCLIPKSCSCNTWSHARHP